MNLTELAEHLRRGIRSRRRIRQCLISHSGGRALSSPAAECVLLLHGFPELAYTWRKVMLPLAAAGYYVWRPISAVRLTEGRGHSIRLVISASTICQSVRDALGFGFALG